MSSEPAPLFQGIKQPVIRTFRHKLIILYQDLGLPEIVVAQAEGIMDQLGLHSADRRATTKALAGSLKDIRSDNPFPDLIHAVSVVAREKYRAGEITEEELYRYQWMGWSVLHVCLELKDEEEEGGDHYNSPIATGCSAARLLLTKRFDIFRRLPAFGKDIRSNFKRMRAFYEKEDQAHSYVYQLFNIFNRHDSEVGPINRQRLSLVIEDLAESGVEQTEEGDFSYKSTLFSIPGVRGNPEEFTADYPAKEKMVENLALDHEDPVAHVPDLQEADNRYYSYARTKKHALVSTDPSRVTLQQAQTIYQACETLYKSSGRHEYVFIALSIILGRSDRKLSELPKGAKSDSVGEHWYKPKGGDWCFKYKIQIPRKTAPQLSGAKAAKKQKLAGLEKGSDEHKRLKKLLDDKSGQIKEELYNHLKSVALEFPVPRFWQKPLGDALKIKDATYDFTDAFKAVQGEVNHSIRRANLAKFLPWSLKQSGVDRYLVSVLSGDDPFDRAAMYYTQTSPQIIYDTYQKIMSELGVTVDLPARADLLDTEDSLTFGSMVIPKAEKIRQLFEDIRGVVEHDDLKDPDTLVEWLHRHNYFALYTYLLLNLATGHRPTGAPYFSSSHFDLRGKRCFIADKDVTSRSIGRSVPLIDVAIEQIEAYKRHLNRLFLFLQGPRGCAVTAYNVMKCADPENDKFPFLFLFPPLVEGVDFDHRKNTKIQMPSPAMVLKHMESKWPIPANWHRHVLRSWLTNYSAQLRRTSEQQDKVITGEMIDAFMGHGQFGLHPDNPQAGFRFSDLKKMLPALEKMFKEYGARAVEQ